MERTVTIGSREELIYLLSEASELEHGLACSYLFAAFSLKSDLSEGLSAEQLAAVGRWKQSIFAVAAQEMLHLSLASNLLTAIGAAPHFRRPNFPQRGSYYPSSFRLGLTPFSEQTLKHFIFLERPEGVELDDTAIVETSAAHPRAAAANAIGPDPQDYTTVGHLYRAIEEGFRGLVRTYGEARVFVGPPRAQATKRYFSFPELIPVTDLASAIAAIELIVEEGEGFRGAWQDAHYGTFLRIHEEYLTHKGQDPTFQPARPVLANPFARVPGDAHEVNLIDDPFTIEVSDLFNAGYEVMLLMLARFFAHTGETEAELRTLVSTAIDAMFGVIQPLGEMLTTLPAGARHPGLTAGPSFEFYRSVHVLPHKHAAWVLFHERLEELAAHCARLERSPRAPRGLAEVRSALARLAAALAQHLP